ncbi:MAG: hypothetical protein WAZ18_05600 [Alphaproteobacteria bacterium]
MNVFQRTVAVTTLTLGLASTAVTPVQAVGHTSITPTLAKIETAMTQAGWYDHMQRDGDWVEIQALLGICTSQGDDASEAHIRLARVLREKVVAYLAKLNAAGVKGLETQTAQLMADTQKELG